MKFKNWCRFSSSRSRVWLDSPIIAEYAEKPFNPVTLDYLLTLERDPTICALYVHKELPIRLARRVRAIERLPFIVGTNPHIQTVYDMYRESFHRLLKTPVPESQETNLEFTNTLRELTTSHISVIPILARGFMEAGQYMSTESKQRFLDEMIRARIGIRVLAEHYLSLQKPVDGWIGIVNTLASPKTILHSICTQVQHICDLNYGNFPGFNILGVDTTVAYINVHMEYIFMELIKNAMRATVEEAARIGEDIKDIEISIGKAEDEITLRFRDRGGGISLQSNQYLLDQQKIWEYSFTTVEQQEEDFFGSKSSMIHSTGGPIAGLGFGLPMSRVYAKYFGGSLDIFSVAGVGVDVFLRFPNISRIKHHEI